jgi:hypothetical protein
LSKFKVVDKTSCFDYGEKHEFKYKDTKIQSYREVSELALDDAQATLACGREIKVEPGAIRGGQVHNKTSVPRLVYFYTRITNSIRILATENPENPKTKKWNRT